MAGSRGRWAVKSATLTFNSATYDIASGVVGKSQARDAVDVTALSDSVKQYIQGALTDNDESTFTLFQKDSGDLTVGAAPAALSISVTLSNGIDTDATVTTSITKAIITKVSYGSIDASGDRKATMDVTFRDSGLTA